MNTFTIAEAFAHGWKKMKETFWVTIGVTASYGLISMAIGRVSDMAKNHGILNLLAFLLSLAVGVAIRVGFTRYFLKADEGKGQYLDLFTMGGVYFTYFVGYVALSFITIVGFVLLFVPGVILAVMYLFVPTLIVDRYLGVIEAFKESAAMTKGHRWHIFGFLVVSLLVNFVGLLVVVVGLLVTIPVTFFAGLYIYRRLLGNEMPAVVPEAPVSPAAN